MSIDTNKFFESKKTRVIGIIVLITLIVLVGFQVFKGRHVKTPIFEANKPSDSQNKTINNKQNTDNSINIKNVEGDAVFGNKIDNTSVKHDTIQAKKK